MTGSSRVIASCSPVRLQERMELTIRLEDQTQRESRNREPPTGFIGNQVRRRQLSVLYAIRTKEREIDERRNGHTGFIAARLREL